MNSYITAPTEEKVLITLGPEIGNDTEKRAPIVRALYGLKSARSDFRAHLGHFMQELVYETCIADPDLWKNAKVIPEGNYEY